MNKPKSGRAPSISYRILSQVTIAFLEKVTKSAFGCALLIAYILKILMETEWRKSFLVCGLPKYAQKAQNCQMQTKIFSNKQCFYNPILAYVVGNSKIIK